MPFSDNEKAALLNVKGVGETVIKRLEEIGIDSFETLKTMHADTVTNRVASMLNNTCWKNSPQAKKAIEAAITRAEKGL